MRLFLIAALLLALPMIGLAQTPPAHHAAKGFVNPYQTQGHPGLGSFLRARFFSGPWASYEPDEFEVPTDLPDVIGDEEDTDNAAVTWLGHSTVLLQHQGVNVLTDPMLSQRASPVAFAGPKRISAPGLRMEQLPRIDVVVISHDHYDHLDARTLRALGNARFFVPLGLGPWLVKQGIDAARVEEMDWWEARSVRFGDVELQVTATPSQHFSGRGLFDRDRSLWASWVVEWPDFVTWFGGDTGYNPVQFAEIGKAFPHIDFGIIPIGAYAPGWFMRTVHVDPAEAVLIHRDIGARYSMGVHWGAFVLSAEPVHEPPELLAAEVAKSGLDADSFSTFAVGETRRYRRN